MFAIAVEYLTGRVVAALSDRVTPEWPPHPARLFMALVATWGELGEAEAGRRVLTRLEALGPPALYASKAGLGASPKCYVPVNDVRGDTKAGAGKFLPADRERKERYFPSVIPDESTVYFVWPLGGLDPEGLVVLSWLCARTTYVGHSRTLVHVKVVTTAPPANLVPIEGRGGVQLRIPWPGAVGELVDEYRAGRRPNMDVWCSYAVPRTDAVVRPVRGALGEDRLIVLRRHDGPRLPLRATLGLTAALRGAVVRAATPPVPELLSGHAPGGGPGRQTHVAYVPLADVGHEHADGCLVGLGVILPAEVDEPSRGACLRAISDAIASPLRLGDLGAWRLESAAEDRRRVLDPTVWVGPARRWATVTPIVLDRHPKREGDAEAVIARACEYAGLPVPVEVACRPVSTLRGVPHARDFPMYSCGKPATQRWHTHAVVVFGAPVSGPVALGRGRFRGYGLCRPQGDA